MFLWYIIVSSMILYGLYKIPKMIKEEKRLKSNNELIALQQKNAALDELNLKLDKEIEESELN